MHDEETELCIVYDAGKIDWVNFPQLSWFYILMTHEGIATVCFDIYFSFETTQYQAFSSKHNTIPRKALRHQMAVKCKKQYTDANKRFNVNIR
jgi:hypothetical protein